MARVTGVEPSAALAAQLAPAWRALLAGHTAGAAVVIVHPEISRVLLGLTLELPPERWGAIRRQPGAIDRRSLKRTVH